MLDKLKHKFQVWLEQEISLKRVFALKLPARLSLKQGLVVICTFTIGIVLLGILVGNWLFSYDDREAFERKISQTGEISNNVPAKIEMAFAYYLKGNFEQAESLYKEILQKEPGNTTAQIYYGLILADRGKYAEAVTLLESGLLKEPGREKLAYLYLGKSYYLLGNNEKARLALEAADKMTPGSPNTNYYLGMISKQAGQISEAKRYLTKALQLSGRNYLEAAQALQELP